MDVNVYVVCSSKYSFFAYQVIEHYQETYVVIFQCLFGKLNVVVSFKQERMPTADITVRKGVSAPQ